MCNTPLLCDCASGRMPSAEQVEFVRVLCTARPFLSHRVYMKLRDNQGQAVPRASFNAALMANFKLLRLQAQLDEKTPQLLIFLQVDNFRMSKV